MQNCDHKELVNYLLDEVKPKQRADFQAHLLVCPKCAEEVKVSQALIEAMKLDIPKELTSDRRQFILSKCQKENVKVIRTPLYLHFIKVSGIVAAMIVIAFIVSQKVQPSNSNQASVNQLASTSSNVIHANDYHIKTAMIGGDNQDGQCIIDISRTPTKVTTKSKPTLTTLVLDTSSLKKPKAIKQQLDKNLHDVLRAMQSHDRVSLIICGVNSSARPSNQSSYTINQIIASIGHIRLTRSTSIKDGVYKGYQHALNRFDEKSDNKLVFLASTDEPINLMDRQHITNCLNGCNQQQISLAMVGFDHIL